MKEKIILAYSGGLDTSVMVKWLAEEKQYDVITLTADVGQGINLGAVKKKALATGATTACTIDLKKEFAENYVLPAIQTNAMYEGAYPLATALARPLIAKALVETAKKEGATAVAHGCTGKGNDQVRFDVTIQALNPDLKIHAPVREWNLTRVEELEYAKKNNIPIPEKIGTYSIDENMWGRSIESGPLEDPMHEPGEEVFDLTQSPEKAPNKAEHISITFEQGKPVALNGKKMDLVKLISQLNVSGGTHGVGRIDHMESRLVGIKSREVYEAPAATILIAAHKDLEKLVHTRHVLSFKPKAEQIWSELVYTGLWIDPLKESLDAFIAQTQGVVNGIVTVKLYKGSCVVVGRSSPNSIYEYDLATYSETDTFDQTKAESFIKLWGLQSVLYHTKNKGAGA